MVNRVAGLVLIVVASLVAQAQAQPVWGCYQSPSGAVYLIGLPGLAPACRPGDTRFPVGSVSRVSSGSGLVGGPITTTGMLAVNTTVARRNAPNNFHGTQTIDGSVAASVSSTSGPTSLAFDRGGLSVRSSAIVGNAIVSLCSLPAVGGADCYGIYAVGNTLGGAFMSDSRGIVATAPQAGLFRGDVSVAGTLTKSAGGFRIDHPLDPANRFLTHSFVESPDMLNLYSGVATLDGDGAAWVDLPDWFEAINGDIRYQLTPIGGPSPDLHIAAEVSKNRFRMAGGRPGAKVSWQLSGIRRDAYAQAHRIRVEEAKTPEERGFYLNPELHGQSGAKQILTRQIRQPSAAGSGK